MISQKPALRGCGAAAKAGTGAISTIKNKIGVGYVGIPTLRLSCGMKHFGNTPFIALICINIDMYQ
jgi:hypothetical protein